jgi:steroid delta-isomerase-like uncharacterized protein
MRKPLFVVSFLLLSAISCLLMISTVSADSQATKHPLQSPETVLRALMSAFNRHDFAALDTLFASDGVYEDFAARFRGVGPAQVKEFLRGVIQTQPDFIWHPTNAIESGSNVTIEWTWAATFTGDGPDGKHLIGQRVSGRGATVAIIENGRIKQLHDYYDDASFFPVASSKDHP